MRKYRDWPAAAHAYHRWIEASIRENGTVAVDSSNWIAARKDPRPLPSLPFLTMDRNTDRTASFFSPPTMRR
jgi:hypothetical protein